MKYGDKTAMVIAKYEKKHPINIGKTRTGVIAPFKDLQRNEQAMEKLNLKEADRYFHCRGNFEAASRGIYGIGAAVGAGVAREIIQLSIGHDKLPDSWSDIKANIKGLKGAIKSKSLKETCPHQHYKYK